MLDKLPKNTDCRLAYSAGGWREGSRNRGGETRVLRPGHVKPKHEVNYAQVVERLPGEDPPANDPPTVVSAHSDR